MPIRRSRQEGQITFWFVSCVKCGLCSLRQWICRIIWKPLLLFHHGGTNHQANYSSLWFIKRDFFFYSVLGACHFMSWHSVGILKVLFRGAEAARVSEGTRANKGVVKGSPRVITRASRLLGTDCAVFGTVPDLNHSSKKIFLQLVFW